MKLVILFGGRSAEHEVSCTSARHVAAAADPQRYEIDLIGIDRAGAWWRADAALAALRHEGESLPDALAAVGTRVDPFQLLGSLESGDVVFPVLHGPMGEDGTMQGLLEIADVAYVGSGVRASAVAMDKIAAKQVLHTAGIPQGRFVGLHVDELSAGRAAAIIDELGLPVFVKPANMGSSVGVSRGATPAEVTVALELAARYDEWLIVEEEIRGREIECAVLGNLDPVASLPGEIEPGADFYDYEDKYDDGAKLLIPAPLDDSTVAAVQALAIETYRALRCEGLARVDFFLEAAAGDDPGRGPLVNEVNTMPGFTPISMYPKLWAVSGLGYPELIDRLVELAQERFTRGGIGTTRRIGDLRCGRRPPIRASPVLGIRHDDHVAAWASNVGDGPVAGVVERDDGPGAHEVAIGEMVGIACVTLEKDHVLTVARGNHHYQRTFLLGIDK